MLVECDKTVDRVEVVHRVGRPEARLRFAVDGATVYVRKPDGSEQPIYSKKNTDPDSAAVLLTQPIKSVNGRIECWYEEALLLDLHVSKPGEIQPYTQRIATSGPVGPQGPPGPDTALALDQHNTDVASHGRIRVLKEAPINVLNPPGALVAAVGDNVANDAPAIQAILDQVKLTGGDIYAPPKTYRLDAGLAYDGAIVGKMAFHGPGAVLRFTPATGSLFTFANSHHVTLEDLTLRYDAGTYAGDLIRGRGPGVASGRDAAHIHIVGCKVEGTSTARGARSLINFNQVILSKIEGCSFAYAQNCIWGGDGSYSVANTVEDCANQVTLIDVSVIRNINEQWRLLNNGFEGLANNKPGAILVDAGVTVHALYAAGNWYGDANAAAAGHWVQFGGLVIGTSFVGERFTSSGTAAGNTSINCLSNVQGLAVLGGRMENGAGQFGLKFAATSRGVLVKGVDMVNVTTQFDGSSFLVYSEATSNPNHPDRHFGSQAMGLHQAAAHRLDINGVVKAKGVATHVNAGAITDSQFLTISDGMLAVDSTNNRLAVRIGGVWKYVAVA